MLHSGLVDMGEDTRSRGHLFEFQQVDSYTLICCI